MNLDMLRLIEVGEKKHKNIVFLLFNSRRVKWDK